MTEATVTGYWGGAGQEEREGLKPGDRLVLQLPGIGELKFAIVTVTPGNPAFNECVFEARQAVAGQGAYG